MSEGTLNILIAASEAVPFVKSGGLADVAGSLPKALRTLRHDARVVLPHYGMIDDRARCIEPMFSFEMLCAGQATTVQVSCCESDGVLVYLIKGGSWFHQDSRLYDGCNTDAPRYVFFCLALAEMLRWTGCAETPGHWIPDVVHSNDWHTGLLPMLLRGRQYATVHTIHNIAYQGGCAGQWLWDFGIDPRDYPDLIASGLTDNLMAIGIAYAGAVNTVSPRYAQELQQPEFGYGLEGLLHRRAAEGEMFGVLNGIDVDRWDPATDTSLESNYDVHSLARKVENKRALQASVGLPVRDDVLLIGMVSRLVEQKGFDLVLPAIAQLLCETDNVQFVLLGTGHAHYVEWLKGLMRSFPDRARVFLKFKALPARHIYAGCDVFLMPSRYEPCGLGQMVAMRYGTLPVVRATGGLADTVMNYDDGAADAGTGFVFDAYSVDALLDTLRWVRNVYFARPAPWQRMQVRAMQLDFSWNTSAREYERRYRQVIARRRAELSAVSTPGIIDD